MSSLPNGLVETTEELVNVWFEYGQAGVRAGFRSPDKVQPPILGNVSYEICRKHDPSSREWTLKCSPFRMDYYTAPIQFPFRDEPVDDMPTR